MNEWSYSGMKALVGSSILFVMSLGGRYYATYLIRTRKWLDL